MIADHLTVIAFTDTRIFQCTDQDSVCCSIQSFVLDLRMAIMFANSSHYFEHLQTQCMKLQECIVVVKL